MHSTIVINKNYHTAKIKCQLYSFVSLQLITS